MTDEANRIDMIIFEGYKIQGLTDNMSDDEFYEFCIANKELRIERDKHKNIIIMAPVGGESGYFEKEFIRVVGNWEVEHKEGVSFSSNVGFILPNGATRSPDSSWVSEERWNSVPDNRKSKFLPVVPDFVVEVRSGTDSLDSLKSKMQEWLENGVRLGWLINPQQKQCFIYRANGSIEILEGFDKILSGEDVMPGFEFDLKRLKMP